jgi:hypothetical protein
VQCGGKIIGTTVKISEIISKEKPDILVILLGTNLDSNNKKSLTDIKKQAQGTTTYWIGTPNHHKCDALGGGKNPDKSIDDNQIRAINQTAATEFGSTYYDTYNLLPNLQLGGKTTNCDIHDLDYDKWAASFWNKFFK